MTENDLEHFEILIEVIDFKAFKLNKLIGSFSVGFLLFLHCILKINRFIHPL